MSAYINTKKLFLNLDKIASNLGYSKENILILENKESELKELFPDVWENIISCSHHKDKRTSFEYAQDLVSSWLLEDHLLNRLLEFGAEIKLSGADKERKILKNTFVSSSSDYIISFNGKERLVELMIDFTGYWAKTKKIDLRDNKYHKLSKSSSLFLGISTFDKKFVLLDFSKDIEAVYTPSYKPYGGKPAYSVKISCEDLIEFNIPKLVAKINSYIN